MTVDEERELVHNGPGDGLASPSAKAHRLVADNQLTGC